VNLSQSPITLAVNGEQATLAAGEEKKFEKK
jgi:hypothetical protein